MPNHRSMNRRVRFWTTHRSAGGHDHALRLRFWLEVSLSALALFSSLLALAAPAWIEWAFRVDPDRGSGFLEWAIAFGFLLMAVGLAMLARSERRRSLKAA
jgi:hypothetical protein